MLTGVDEESSKQLLPVHPRYREYKVSYANVLSSLVGRGLISPRVCVGDGALGLWAALRATGCFEKCKEQRCGMHKIANVLDKLSKRLQSNTKGMLLEIMRAEPKAWTEKVHDEFLKLHRDKFPKSTHCLEKGWAKLTTYFRFPAAYWIQFRTTNPIESPFATGKLRTKVVNGAGSKEAAATMACKLSPECQKRWR